MAKKSSSRRSVAPRRGRTETGQGMSISTIIVAAIGLIVLVVLVATFTGQMGKWTSGSRERENRTHSASTPHPKGLAEAGKQTPAR